MMYGRAGLDRFKKAQSLEPFSVAVNSSPKTASQPAPNATNSQGSNSYSQNLYQHSQHQQSNHLAQKPTPDAVPSAPTHVTQVGGGESTWQPPDWAIEPRPGVYYLEVLKDGDILDQISLDRRRHIFGRQFHTCDFVLDHQSVSRQHAAVVPHKNGSIYVIDLGSAHGTFVANERLIKDTPIELEVGQSLRFAASTRTYVLRKNNAALFPPMPPPAEVNLPPPPDPSDEDAVVAYNTILNRYGLSKSDISKPGDGVSSSRKDDKQQLPERAAKRAKKMRVAFRDQVGGELVELVGVSDGADVDTEPGPIGVKEGSLVGKYESLVQVTVVPRGKDQSSTKDDKGNSPRKGVTNRLQEVLNKVKTPSKSGIYDDLYGESFPGKMGSSWAYSSGSTANADSSSGSERKAVTDPDVKEANETKHEDDEDDDLFGD